MAYGGPAINIFGTTMPIPFTSVTYANGVTDNATVFGSLATTSLAFGVIQGELGMVRNLMRPDSTKSLIPGLSATPMLNFGVDVWDGNAKLWPQVDVNAYWPYGKRESFLYAGMSNWFELAGTRAHGEVQESNYVWNPHLGTVFNRTKWQYNVEVKYLAPNYSNQEVVVDYAKPFGDKGGIGAYFSITRKL